MSIIDDLLKLPPYQAPVTPLLPAAMKEAIAHHCNQCPEFGRWYRKQGLDPDAEITNLQDVPFLPVSIFKRMTLRSVAEKDIVRVLRSSATSSQTPSRVVLDAVTRDRQMRTLAQIMSVLLGPKRRPFLVLDAAPSQTGDVELSARVAGMRGYLMMASQTQYALTASMEVNLDEVRAFLEKYIAEGTPVCVLSYTYMLYQYVAAPLAEKGISLPMPPGSSVIHFGGWKRLAQQAVNRDKLNRTVGEVFRGDEELPIRDVYGFTEQLGVIYPDDGHGVRTAPVYSEVIVRDPLTLEPLMDGREGLLQFLTPLPNSYPGISVLLDDMGRIVSSSGGKTKFEVTGRARGAEVRGCGDTLPDSFYQKRV